MDSWNLPMLAQKSRERCTHHWPKHDTNNSSHRNGFVEFTHTCPKVARTLHAPLAQKTNKKQMNETPNKDKQTTGNNSRPATAATNSRNFRTVGHPEIPARKNGFNTSFSKENSELLRFKLLPLHVHFDPSSCVLYVLDRPRAVPPPATPDERYHAPPPMFNAAANASSILLFAPRRITPIRPAPHFYAISLLLNVIATTEDALRVCGVSISMCPFGLFKG